jgi:Fic family protein
MLFNMPVLDDLERAVIERIDEVKSSIRYAVAQPKRWYGLLRRSTFARAIRASNSIEGFNVTVDDAIAAADGEAPLEADPNAWAAGTGYRQAMTYVLQLADDPYFGYSADLLRGLHFMMMQYDLTKNPGRWRPGPIYVRDEERNEVVYEGPDAELLPSLIEELVASLNDDSDTTHPIVKAAMGHLNLLMIHPYSDGNGRMARGLQTLILAREGTLAPAFASIEEYLGRNTREYYDVLAAVGAGKSSPQLDARPWIRFSLTAHFRQATTLLRRSREMQRLWDALEHELDASGLPDRTVLALGDAALGFRVRNSTYRSAAELSDQVASRDLKTLVDHGFLVAYGERRGRYYIASDRLKDLRAKTASERRPIPDPFESDLSQTALFK